MLEIYKYLVHRDSDDKKLMDLKLGYNAWFCSVFPISEFAGEELVLRNFLEYCNKLEVPVKYKYLEVYLDMDLIPMLKKTRVHVTGTESLSFDDPLGLETAKNITTNVICDIHREMEEEKCDIEDFKVSADAFMTRRLNERLGIVLSRTYEMSTVKDNKDVLSYALENLSALEMIYDRTNLEELEVYKHDKEECLELLCDSGLSFIDSDFGGLYRTQLGGIEAQPGAGKTRFALGVWVYRAAVVYHLNVIYFAMEQSKKEIEAMLVARHVFQLYNVQINSNDILTGKVPDDLMDYVKTARIDLFESGKYGHIEIDERLLYLDTFISVLVTLDKLKGPFDVFVIDYMGLMEQSADMDNGYKVTLKDYQIISRAFKLYKRFVRKYRRAGIAISQFNREGIAAGENDQKITTTMAQGGIEVYRNTDWNIALSSTEEMKLQHKIRMEEPKIRNTEGFGRVLCDCRLGFCYFYQQVKGKL